MCPSSAGPTGVSKGEINRELTALKRMFNLAIQAGKLLQKPHIPFLKENNVRVGFFEREQFVSELQRLPEPVRPVAAFAYITGWRIDGEVLCLEWRQVDFAGGEVRLDPGKTKNGEGRTFPMTRELRAILDHRRSVTENLQRGRAVVCARVFHRAGQPIKSFRAAFRPAPKPDAPAAFCMTSVELRSAISSAPTSLSGLRCR